jgi:hypothetical protein
MTKDGTLVEAYLRDAAFRRNHDVRYDILLEVGYLLHGEVARSWCNILRIAKENDGDRTYYYIEAFIDRRDVIVFEAVIDGAGEVEWGIFNPEHWRTDLANWYSESHNADLLATPRIGAGE